MKIDTSAIPGYADMTAEEKLAALEAFDFQPGQSEDAAAKEKHFRDLISKANGEAAEYKKQLREHLNAEEKEKLEREEAAKKAAEEQAEKDRKYDELLKKTTITELTAKYLALGWSQELASATAQAQYDGDTDKVFANMKTFADSREKEIIAEAAKRGPKPGGSTGGEAQGEDVTIAKQLGERAAKSGVDAKKALDAFIK